MLQFHISNFLGINIIWNDGTPYIPMNILATPRFVHQPFSKNFKLSVKYIFKYLHKPIKLSYDEIYFCFKYGINDEKMFL